MPPILRPRPNVTQKSPPVAGRRRTLAANEPKAQSQPSPASRLTRKPQKYPNKQRGRPSKGKKAEKPKLPPTSRLAGDSSRHRRQSPTSAGQILEQRGPQQPRQDQISNKSYREEESTSKPEPVAIPDGSTAILRRSARVDAWVGEVHQEVLPEVLDIPSVNRLPRLKDYVKSTPWYRNDWYDTFSEEMQSPSVATPDVQSKSQGKSRCFELANSKAVTVLAGRNVDFDAVVDDDKEWIEHAILRNSSQPCSAEEEQNWKNDLSKCKVSDEAILQRTIMMDLINRHHLQDTLDYTCESQWKCPSSMPQKKSELATRMPKPKPDLAVAFRANSLLPTFQQTDLDTLRNIMCPESDKEDKRDRAFHFLSIEVKGTSGPLGNQVAHRQNFNTATQALHNIYVFMDLAGPEALRAFYKKVRFYSVVATGLVFHVRVHRAIELKKGRIEKSYPLGFVYDIIHNHQGGDYTKNAATGIIKNILIEYGTKILQPLLAKTLEKVWDNLQSQQDGLADEVEQHRSHGRAASRNGRDASAASRSRKTPSIRGADTSFTRRELDGLTVQK